MSMYNEDWKSEYISFEGVNMKAITNRFKQFAKYEERYKKDLCEMSVDELKSVFSALNIVSFQTRLNTKSLMNGYIDWCVHTKKTNKENALKLLSVDDIASPNAYEMRMLKSPEQCNEILDIVFEGEENLYPNKITMSKLIFWLFYSGVSDNDIQILKKDSIDYEVKTILSPTQENVIYKAFDEVIPLWKKFIDVDEIEFDISKKDLGRYNQLLENDYLFRQFANKKSGDYTYMQAHIFRSYLRKIFVRYQEETGTHLLVSVSNMALSGYFYRLYTSSKTDNDIKNEIFESNGSNKSKSFSMYANYKEWRNYFYNV